MKTIIKAILYEWLEQDLPDIIKREINLSRYLDMRVNKIITITGFRRIGKTYLAYDLIKKLLKEKSKKDVLYINFEDERIPQKTEFLTQLLPAVKEIFGRTPQFLFLDEVQNIPNWSKWLRRIYDKENIRIFVTGSSSKMSSREIPTELRGRCLEQKVYPLSFKEFLAFKNIKVDFKNLAYLENQKAKVIYSLEEYLLFGGMPEVALADKTKKKEILQQYFSSVLRRDVIERFKVKNEEALKATVNLLLNSIIFSISRVYKNLKSANLKIGKTTISHYLGYIENSYFMEPVPLFSYKIKDQLQYPRKIYFIDNGFINALSLKFSKNYGRLFENSTFVQLKRKYPELEIFYWKDSRQKEVDFICKEDAEVKLLIQVCYDIADSQTKTREIKALIKASQELKCDNLLIITNDFEGGEKVKDKKIKFIPLWKWMLKQ